MDLAHFDEMVRALQVGDPVDWGAVCEAESFAAFLHRLDLHGVAAGLQLDETVPPDVAEQIKRRRMHAIFWETEHQEMLVALLNALENEGVESLIIKGTALAYGLYADPHLRIRADTDLVVRKADRACVEEILFEHGFSPLTVADSDVLVGELCWRKVGKNGPQSVDLHWRVMNNAFLGDIFELEELFARSVPLPRLHASAKATHPVDALAIACVHRLVHLQSPYYVGGVAYKEPDRLIWLRDIDLLVRSLDQNDEATFVKEAQARGIVAACYDGLTCANRVMGTPMIDELAYLRSETSGEASEKFLHAGQTGQVLMNVSAAKGFRGLLSNIGAILLPSAAYMKHRYPQSGWPLPFLYFHRALSGLASAIARTFARRD
ncbi:MAG: nucleotidyltransferase family protein [Pseudomonadota bacterium]